MQISGLSAFVAHAVCKPQLLLKISEHAILASFFVVVVELFLFAVAFSG